MQTMKTFRCLFCLELMNQVKTSCRVGHYSFSTLINLYQENIKKVDGFYFWKEIKPIHVWIDYNNAFSKYYTEEEERDRYVFKYL